MNTTKQALSYRELQSLLKPFKVQGFTTVKLNSSYDVLLAEYAKVKATAFATCEYATEENEYDNVSDDFSSINNDDYSWSDMQLLIEQDKVAEPKTQVADHMDFFQWDVVSFAKRQQLTNALNFRLTAYGITLADSVYSVSFCPSNDLWTIKYFNRKSDLAVEIMYDSELANCFNQTKDIPVFDPMEELLNIVSALREEFAGIKLILSGQKAIINFRGLALTFLARDNQLIFCTRAWDCGNSWVQDNVDKTYRTHEQVQGLKAQLRSDFWFEMEVLEVA